MPTKDIQDLINQRMAIEFAMNTKTIEKGLKEVVNSINNKESITWNVDQTGFTLGRQKANTYITQKRNEYFGKA
jgi:SRSO17 transposase